MKSNKRGRAYLIGLGAAILVATGIYWQTWRTTGPMVTVAIYSHYLGVQAVDEEIIKDLRSSKLDFEFGGGDFTVISTHVAEALYAKELIQKDLQRHHYKWVYLYGEPMPAALSLLMEQNERSRGNG